MKIPIFLETFKRTPHSTCLFQTNQLSNPKHNVESCIWVPTATVTLCPYFTMHVKKGTQRKRKKNIHTCTLKLLHNKIIQYFKLCKTPSVHIWKQQIRNFKLCLLPWFRYCCRVSFLSKLKWPIMKNMSSYHTYSYMMIEVLAMKMRPKVMSQLDVFKTISEYIYKLPMKYNEIHVITKFWHRIDRNIYISWPSLSHTANDSYCATWQKSQRRFKDAVFSTLSKVSWCRRSGMLRSRPAPRWFALYSK